MPVDVHDLDDLYHPETKQFPPHNIRGTTGRNLYGSLQQLYDERKEEIHWMDKTRFSAFAGTDLELLLRARRITELHLVGVCTDICKSFIQLSMHTTADLILSSTKKVLRASILQVMHGHFVILKIR